MTYFLIGIVIGIIIGVILGAVASKLGNITDQVTNITGGKQVIKDSPGSLISTELNQVEQPIKKNRIFGKIFNRKNDKI